MKKFMSKTIVTAVALSLVLSAPLHAAANNGKGNPGHSGNNGNNGKGQPKQERVLPNQEKKEERGPKQQSDKHIAKIDDRLDRIESDIYSVRTDIASYFDITFDNEQQNNDETVEVSEEEEREGAEEAHSNEIESDETKSAGEESTTENDAEVVAQAKVEESDEDSSHEEATEEDVNENAASEDENNQNDEEASDEEGMVDELEEELQELENQRHHSFAGKLNAQLNKLNAVENRLGKGSLKSSEATEEVAERVEQLRELAEGTLSTLREKQSSLVDRIVNDENNKEFEQEDVSPVSADKTWSIQFSTKLNASTVNSENFIVSNSEEEIIEVDITYNEATGTVTIEPVETFVTGEAYMLFISSDVTSEEGQKLVESITMSFSIE
ncbi:Ig-like domain-containing protein [Desertibacillus haloalkaliphilus]|uniref:Ig-like domain-containing protein n=1 Tax=Desertibacillus haloalkaliphilus TaxID=1328930 RepID=UPI001C251DBA|nr:Ig-like domain-containing protein [Desertibacillus haloalkaliphilus]MBU8905926.1 Ig-like domain-containing protein [Desertibacillus haloalkaliphilus]